MADQQTEQMGADFRTGEEENVDQLVLYEKIDKHIALITLNRPERLTAMLAPYSFQELGRKMAMAQDDDEIKVIILTGAGRAFSAGVDLRRTPIEAAGLRPGQRLPQSLRMHRPGGGGERANILNSDKTTIAAVNGDAVAAGFHVVMQCDLVVASETARMGEPEARIGFAGFTPDMVMMLLKMGINRGREAILTGRMMPAKELHEWGIVNSVVPQDQSWTRRCATRRWWLALHGQPDARTALHAPLLGPHGRPCVQHLVQHRPPAVHQRRLARRRVQLPARAQQVRAARRLRRDETPVDGHGLPRLSGPPHGNPL